MFKIDNDKTIHLTRGNIASIDVTANNDDGTNYIFQAGDVVRLNVFKNKDCGCIELQKDVTVEAETEAVEVNLTGEETRIGELINKPSKYWYEIELNPDTNPQTIIGYDIDGAKLFILYPEGGDKA
jgi:hypothetical protein